MKKEELVLKKRLSRIEHALCVIADGLEYHLPEKFKDAGEKMRDILFDY